LAGFGMGFLTPKNPVIFVFLCSLESVGIDTRPLFFFWQIRTHEFPFPAQIVGGRETITMAKWVGEFMLWACSKSTEKS